MWHSRFAERVGTMLERRAGARGVTWTLSMMALALITSPLLAVQPLILDGEGAGRYSPGLHSYFLEDPEGKLTFEDVRSPAMQNRWSPADRETFNFGFTSSTYWIRFEVQGEAGRENLFLEVMYPLLDYVSLYSVPGGQDGAGVQGDAVPREGGDMIPFSRKEIPYRNTVFEVSGSGTTTYFLRFRSASSMEIPLALWTKNEFSRRTNSELMAFGIYYGMLLIMVFYNLILAATLRDRVYLYYVLYIVSALLTQATMHGISAQYLWPESPRWVNVSLPFWLNMDLFWGTLFCVSFLNTKENLPGLHFVLLGIIAMTLAGSGLVFVVGYGVAMKYSMLLLVLIPVFLFAAGVKSYLAGVKVARVFLLAWALLLAAIAVAALKAAGLLPTNFFTDYSVQIGTALEVLLLSLALADRISVIEKEREEALAKQLIESEKVASLSTAFKKFVPHEFLECLEKDDITQISLGDNVHRVMSVLFADIRSFTTLSESMSPDQNFRFINAYLSRMQPLISKNGGFIDKYLGDAIMALFDKHPEDAILTAIEMQQTLVEYNMHRNKSGYPPLRIGTGINTGPLMLGIIGGVGRLEGTVIADAVNLASRIEGMTKIYGASILISEHTHATLANPGQFAMRIIDRVKVRGKTTAVTIYEVMDGDSEEMRQKKLETLALFEQGMALYADLRFDEGLQVFRQCHSIHPEDLTVILYIKRGLYYQKHGWKGEEAGVSVMGDSGFRGKV